MIALGLLILVAAGVVGAVGVLGNDGASHDVPRAFEVLGVEFTGSTGQLFLLGIVVGVVGTLGLGLMLSGSRRRVRHGVDNRRERRVIKGEAESLQEERDRLAEELEAERRQREAVEAEAGAVSIADADRGVVLPPSSSSTAYRAERPLPTSDAPGSAHAAAGPPPVDRNGTIDAPPTHERR